MIPPISGDSVICQNFLMKRSQVTRIFRRRFAILTANGKLYSFRKVDLTRPESVHLSQASLVWDIRGCSVECAGPGKWTLKPTGPNLKEEIHLKTCGSLPNFSAFHWVRIMVAVARNNLGSLSGFPTLNITLTFPPLLSLWAEVEGCMHRLQDDNGSYSASIVVRDNDPGACMIFHHFEAGNETSVAQSSLIPRYRFAKPAWSRTKSQQISLSYENGLNLVGAATMVINEGLQAYSLPILSAPKEPPNFDLAGFKFQIKRLIRLIDLLGEFKDAVVEIFEWKDPFVSLCWATYLTIILLFYPGLIPSCIVGHLVWYSWTKKRLDFRAVNQDSSAPESVTSPSNRALPIVTSPALPSSRIKAAMKEVVQTVMSKPATTNELKTEIWENQRRVIGGTQFHASNLSIFDRSRWSDATGSVPLEAPSNREWKIDVDPRNTDENGWMYSFRWNNSSDYHATFGTFDFVRRRRWVPLVSSPQTSVASQPSSLPPLEPVPQFDLNVDELPVVTSLTSMVTSGPEYGNIQDDYDEADHQQLPGFTNIFQEFKSTANRAQIEIANISEEIERYFSLLSWRDELVSTVATTALVLGLVLLLIIPINLLLYAFFLSHFHAGYRRNKWRSVAKQCIQRQHIAPLFQNKDSTLSGLEAHKLCLALSKATGTNVSQKVLAEFKHDLAGWICRQHPAFSKVRKWMKRDWIENFLDHVPPDVCDEQNVFFVAESFMPPPLPAEPSTAQVVETL